MQSLPLAPQLAVTKPHSPRCKGHHDSPIPALPECLLGPQPVQKMSGRQRGEHGPVSEGTFGVFDSLKRLGCGASRALAWQHAGEVLPAWFPGLYLSLTTPAGNCLDPPPQLHSLCPPWACRGGQRCRRAGRVAAHPAVRNCGSGLGFSQGLAVGCRWG